MENIIEDQLYTAWEVKKITWMSNNDFYYWVRMWYLPVVMEPKYWWKIWAEVKKVLWADVITYYNNFILSRS